jgi:hypothetical protein
MKFLRLAVWGLVVFSCINAYAYYGDYIGKEVTLRSFTGTGKIYVGTDKERFNALTGNLMGEARSNYAAGYLAHEWFEVYTPTKAKVLDFSLMSQAVKVRILEGTHAGEEGWVLLEQAFGY